MHRGMDDEAAGERTPALGGSRGGASVRAHSSSPRRVPLFERASARWWNPQFRSPTLEAQYWKCSFSQLRDRWLSTCVGMRSSRIMTSPSRFRSGLIYIALVCIAWTVYLAIFNQAGLQHWVSARVCVFHLVFPNFDRR